MRTSTLRFAKEDEPWPMLKDSMHLLPPAESCAAKLTPLVAPALHSGSSGVCVGLAVCVGSAVGLGVPVGVRVAVRDRVAEREALGVRERLWVGDALGIAE